MSETSERGGEDTWKDTSPTPIRHLVENHNHNQSYTMPSSSSPSLTVGGASGGGSDATTTATDDLLDSEGRRAVAAAKVSYTTHDITR